MWAVIRNLSKVPRVRQTYSPSKLDIVDQLSFTAGERPKRDKSGVAEGCINLFNLLPRNFYSARIHIPPTRVTLVGLHRETFKSFREPPYLGRR